MSIQQQISPSPLAYLTSMLRSPLAAWWGAITFALEIIAFVVVDPIIVISRIWLVVALLLLSLSSFLGLVILFKGWPLYVGTFHQINIRQIVRIEDQQVFVLDSARQVSVGSLLEIRRLHEHAEIPIGVLVVDRQSDEGSLQASPLWIMPGHLRDIETHKVSLHNLVVNNTIAKAVLERWIDDEAESRVQDLLRKGIGQ